MLIIVYFQNSHNLIFPRPAADCPSFAQAVKIPGWADGEAKQARKAGRTKLSTPWIQTNKVATASYNIRLRPPYKLVLLLFVNPLSFTEGFLFCHQRQSLSASVLLFSLLLL